MQTSCGIVIIKSVELFAGIGGFWLATDQCGYKTNWANDLCPLACQVYSKKFGGREIVQGVINKLLDDMPKQGITQMKKIEPQTSNYIELTER